MWLDICEGFKRSAAPFTTPSMSCMWTTPFKLRWQGKVTRTDYVLFDSPSDEISVQQSGQRKHDGDADASEERPQPALPDVSSFGEPAMQGLQLSRPPGEPCAPLRYSG